MNGTVERTSTPGAENSTLLFLLEKDATAPFELRAPTEMTESYEAGYLRVVLPSLPADATERMPASYASPHASSSIELGVGPPRLILITCAPAPRQLRTAAIRSEATTLALQSSPKNFTM